VRVAAAILTYRALSTGRGRLLRRCWESLQEADAVYLVDNGSGDGTEVLVDWLGGYCHRGTLHTSGHGTNLCARILAGDGADICVHSDDDMVWRPGWRAKLERWWAEAPGDVAITGCHLEGDWPWNQRTGKALYGGIPAFVRTSTGAASWAYRASMASTIFPIPQQVQGFGDVPTCDRLTQSGLRVCQIDLATHEGRTSTWGNLTERRYGPADVERLRAEVAS
jgi:glycosyltransferase involved in cell wall biosynthesis